MEKLRICTECSVHHYENCNSCWGFGVYKISDRVDEAWPVLATDVVNKVFKSPVLSCPECGSTEKGIPIMKGSG